MNDKPSNPKDVLGVRRVPMSCVPAGVMMEVGLALGEGAAKYGRHNFRAVGVQASVYYDAAIGHLMDWWEGDDVDADSGLSHVVKAIASLTVLRDAMLQGKLNDNRPPRSKVFKRDFNGLAGEILDKHADKKPRHYTIADSGEVEVVVKEEPVALDPLDCNHAGLGKTFFSMRRSQPDKGRDVQLCAAFTRGAAHYWDTHVNGFGEAMSSTGQVVHLSRCGATHWRYR